MTSLRYKEQLMLFVLLPFVSLHPSVCIAQVHHATSNETSCPGDTVDQLPLEVAKQSRAFVARLKSAIEVNDRSLVGSMIRYPLLVHIADKTFPVHTPEEFLHNYDRIMNPAVRSAINDPQSSKCLFFSSPGFMIGNGEVWFQKSSAVEYKIVTINLGAPR